MKQTITVEVNRSITYSVEVEVGVEDVAECDEQGKRLAVVPCRVVGVTPLTHENIESDLLEQVSIDDEEVAKACERTEVSDLTDDGDYQYETARDRAS